MAHSRFRGLAFLLLVPILSLPPWVSYEAPCRDAHEGASGQAADSVRAGCITGTATRCSPTLLESAGRGNGIVSSERHAVAWHLPSRDRILDRGLVQPVG